MASNPAILSSLSIQSAYGLGKDSKDIGSAAGTQGTDFAQLVARGAQGAVDTVRQGDATALSGLSGTAGLQQVVEATMAMESTVQISVAVRDKLVEAYQEILRMPM